MTRETFTRSECMRLDALLAGSHRVVTQIFDSTAATRLAAPNSGRSEGVLRQEALLRQQVLAQGSYEADQARRREEGLGGSRGRRSLLERTRIAEENALRREQERVGFIQRVDGGIVDEDDWEVFPGLITDDTPPLPSQSNSSARVPHEPTGVYRRAPPSEAFPSLSRSNLQLRDPKPQQPSSGRGANRPQTSLNWRAKADVSNVAPNMSAFANRQAPRDRPARLTQFSNVTEQRPDARPSDAPDLFAPLQSNAAALERLRAQEAGAVSSSLDASVRDFATHGGTFLCPYTPGMLAQCRDSSVGLSFVSSIENRLQTMFPVRANQHVSFAPMNKTKRDFICRIAIYMWGLEATTVDPPPNSHVRIHASLSSSVPRFTLLKALETFQWSYLSEPMCSWSGSSKPQKGIGILGLRGRGDNHPSPSLHELLSSVGRCRRSEYELVFLDEHNVFVEFASMLSAKKAFKRLRETTSAGGFTIRAVQWLPFGGAPYYAKQVSHLASKARELENLTKQVEKLNLKEKKLRSERGANKTGWDDDEGDDDDDGRFVPASASSYVPKSKQTMKKKKNKSGAKGGFAALASSSSDEDQDEDSD